MNVILDPIWPWSILWDHLQRVPFSVRLVALGASLGATLLTILVLSQARVRTLYVVASGVAAGLALVCRHVWSGMYGMSFLGSLGVLVLVVGLLVFPTMLIGLSVGTYVQSKVTRAKLTTIITLRLVAFILALIAVSRPALAWTNRQPIRSLLLILVDRSQSMTIQDATGKTSRWDAVQRALNTGGPALDRLRDELGTEVRFFAIGDEFSELDLNTPGEPNGKRTEVGLGLRGLLDQRDPKLHFRGALLLSDGADNGGVAALSEASRFRAIPTALHTFVVGNPATNRRQNDIAITSISVSPAPFIPLKGKIRVKVVIDARGFENTRPDVSLKMELPDSVGKLTEQQLAFQSVPLPLSTGNEVTLEADAPATPGEYKVIVEVHGERDDFPLNNRIETFATVSKEGMSILLVDRRRGWEPQFIIDALKQDARVSITPLWLGGQSVPGKLAFLDDQPFDAIILGDVSIAQMKMADPEFVSKIVKQVARGAGLLVLGGYINLASGDWKDSRLTDMLPVDLRVGGQLENSVRIVPTDDGQRLAPYLLRLDDDPDWKRSWEKLAKLDGATQLTLLPPARRGLDTVLATADNPAQSPLLVMRNYATGGAEAKSAGSRIVVFGGDTTFRWVRNPRTREVHQRFWRQMATWLARQEDAQGSVWVRPDAVSRRIPVGADLGFAVGVRGKGGGPDLANGKFTAEVTTPDGTKSSVTLSRSTAETRGVFQGTRKPGTYTISVTGEGTDPSGTGVSGQSTARVIVYDEDLEMTRPAADVEFMKKLATAGGGEALTLDMLPEFLNRLAEQPQKQGKQRGQLRPDWQTSNRSGFLALYFVVFVLILGLEWGLRRWWGLV